MLINPSGYIVTSNGTSFATPLLAGMAATLWSALPDENAMQIRERIIRSAHLYPNHDTGNQMGYGIPNAWLAYTMPNPMLDIRNTENESAPDTRKVLIDGQIYIVRNGQIYTLSGLRLE